MSNKQQPPLQTVESKYLGIIAAINETKKEMYMLTEIEPFVTDTEALDKRKLRLKSWLNYYINELNTTGHGPKEQGEAGATSL